LFVESFLGTSNFVDARVASTDGNRATIEFPFASQLDTSVEDAVAAGDEVTASLRPERLSVAPERIRTDGATRSRGGLRFEATVDSRLHRGSRYRYELIAGDTSLVTHRRIADRLDVEPGDVVSVRCDPTDVTLFDDEGRRIR
jgi:ABC-type Fe3+/spermidine/putrescine transport system ATPase subunit